MEEWGCFLRRLPLRVFTVQSCWTIMLVYSSWFMKIAFVIEYSSFIATCLLGLLLFALQCYRVQSFSVNLKGSSE